VQISSSLVTTDTSFTSVQPYKRKLGRQRGQGIASWYGPGFHGRRTANGERFNRYALTAAHKTLPLGTRLSVFNPRTGKQIVVRINDRGPYIGRRVLDLSEAAATALGFKSRGRDWVIFTALKPTENAPPVQGPGAAAEITETTQTAMTVTAHPSEPISAVSDYNDDEGEGEMLSTSVFLSDPSPTSRR
jgi:rare lipoprotein A